MSRKILKLLNEANSSLPIEEKFTNDIKKLMSQLDYEEQKRPSNYYKPSSLHCIRQMYYTRVKAPTDKRHTDYQLVGMADIGTKRHESIQRVLTEFKKNNYRWEYIDIEQYVKEKQKKGKCKDIEILNKKGYETHLHDKKHDVSFLCDGIIKDSLHNDYYLFEFKNVISYSFRGINEAPLEKHKNQVACYCALLDLNKAFILYENRDILELKACLYNVRDSEKKAIKHKIRECEDKVNTNALPDKEIGVWCKYCAYKEMCKNDKNERGDK